jgi:hypothetical protein
MLAGPTERKERDFKSAGSRAAEALEERAWLGAGADDAVAPRAGGAEPASTMVIKHTGNRGKLRGMGISSAGKWRSCEHWSGSKSG